VAIFSTLLPSYAENRPKQETSKQSLASDEKLPSTLFGEWKGTIRTYRGDVPLSFSILESGDIHAKLGSQLETVVNTARFKDGGLGGRISGDLGVDDDTGPERYSVDFELYLRDGKLQGAAVTRGNAGLPFWTELKKIASTAGQP
jgi:hypothetical protein